MHDGTNHQGSLRQTDRVAELVNEVRSQEQLAERAPNPPTANAAVAFERTRSALVGNPAFQAFWVLRIGFTVVPIVAGLDKFFHLLVDWDKYVPAVVADLIGGHANALMLAAGVIEIAAGIGVALWPRIFAYVVSAWLLGIVLNLLLLPAYYDIALRDLGLAVGALVLGRLSEVYARGHALSGNH